MFFKCPIAECAKLFNCKKALKEHERTHDNNRPFKCESCDQTFTQYSSLQKHARVHDKQKPYSCDHPGCTQAFSQVSNLIRHQRIHTGDKPFKCAYCTKKFASGSNLKQHLQIHQTTEGRSNFECIFDGCKKNYLYQSSLKKHYLVSHKEQYEELLADQKIQTCGFRLNEKGEKVPIMPGEEVDKIDQIIEKQPKVADETEENIIIQKDNNTITIELDDQTEIIQQPTEPKEPKEVTLEVEQEQTLLPNKDDTDNEKQRLKDEAKRRMVEKGLMQSQQIKENPLTQNFAVGKRGRPPNIMKNPNPSKKVKKDPQSQMTLSEANMENSSTQNDAIKDAIAQLQKNQGLMSQDEFTVQKQFLGLISQLQEGLQGDQNANQLPSDIQKLMKASSQMGQADGNINQLIQNVLQKQNHKNDTQNGFNHISIQQMMQGLTNQNQNVGGNLNNFQQMGYQPSGSQFAPTANMAPVSQQEQLQYLLLMQQQQQQPNQQQQLAQVPPSIANSHPFRDNLQNSQMGGLKPQDNINLQKSSLHPQMTVAQQMKIGGNININLSNINLNQFNIKANNAFQSGQVGETNVQDSEKQDSFLMSKVFSLQNFIGEPGNRERVNSILPNLVDSQHNFNNMRSQRNQVNVNDSSDNKILTPLPKSQVQSVQITQQSKFRQMLADEDAFSSEISDQEDEVDNQVKEPQMSAIKGRELSAIKGKEDNNNGVVAQFGDEMQQKQMATQNQQQNQAANANGNHFYNCQFIISGANGVQGAPGNSDSVDNSEQIKDKNQEMSVAVLDAQENSPKDLQNQIPHSGEPNQNKLLTKQQPKILIKEELQHNHSSIGELVGPASQNALNNDSVKNIDSIQNMTQLKNSVHSLFEGELNIKSQETLQNQNKYTNAIQQLFGKQSTNSLNKFGDLQQIMSVMPGLKNIVGNDKRQSLDPNTDHLKLSSNSLLQDRMIRQASQLFGPIQGSERNLLDQQHEKAGGKLGTNNSFLLDKPQLSRRNLLMSHANLNNALENHVGLRSKFSSHLNLLPTTGNGIVMTQSNIFDQFQNTQFPTKPPSICSRSNNGRSNPNLLKYSSSLTDVNPQQAHDLLRRISKQNPEQLNQLIQQTQQLGQQQQSRAQLQREYSNRSFSNLSASKFATNSMQIPNPRFTNRQSGKMSTLITPQSATTSNNQQKRLQQQVPDFTDACKAVEQQQNKSNKKFMQNLNKLSKEGKMSGLFNALHMAKPGQNDVQLGADNVRNSSHDQEVITPNAIISGQASNNDEKMAEGGDEIIQQAAPNGNIPDKSADEFEDDEDQEVDGLFFDEDSPYDRQQSGITADLDLKNLKVENEDDPVTNLLPTGDAQAESLQSQLNSFPLDAQNIQTLMNNPALTQHLITVLSTNLSKTDTVKTQEEKNTQATPVFSYAEIMRKQLQNDKSNTKPNLQKMNMDDNNNNLEQKNMLNQMMSILNNNNNQIQPSYNNQAGFGDSNQIQHKISQIDQPFEDNQKQQQNPMMLPVSTMNRKKYQQNVKKQ